MEITKQFQITRATLNLWLKIPLHCALHDKLYFKWCSECYSLGRLQHFEKLLLTLDEGRLKSQIERLSQKDRSGETFNQRALLVKKLHEDPELHMSFSDIGRLLKRDHTSISNAYQHSLKLYENQREYQTGIGQSISIGR